MQNSTSLRKAGKLFVDWAAVIVLIVSVIIFTILRGSAFFSVANLINIFRAMSTMTIFALAATVSMAPDGFDMAAGTLGSFCAYVFASCFLWFAMPLWLSIVITIVFAMVMYLLNMFLILVCKVPDMLATCALQFVHQGLGLAFTGGSAVSAGMSTPGWATALKGGDSSPLRSGWTEASQNIGKSPYIIIIMLLCVVLCFILLERTKYGRYLYAMGGNKMAARLSGIDVKKMRFMAGMFAALFIAVGGIVVCSRNSAAQINGSDSYLMSSLAAVFIGRSVGGREKYNALGTAIGALLIAVLENGMTMCGVVYYILPAVKGAVLCLALIAAYITSKED
ncbi:MAG TPA: ABC transporter permease [Candidatus Merdiplasma excrementigallinarum]|uniref:ABC transporter permease n=1 Tax=Candidatus Merdiplasma excrementigallinarum TaxID=2840864 RepID=A0A9D1P046_9FIRM|nr:ABC transporter permease [Candidatus Merdiplasma excrementigallinarum]